MTTHELKTWPEQFRDVACGVKKFELRKNDRDFNEGDLLVLKEWAPGEEQGIYYGAAVDPGFRGYSGDECTVRVTHIFWPGWHDFGLHRGYVAMSIELVKS